jgi:hypothetical protein
MNNPPIRDPERYFAALADEAEARDSALDAIRDEQAAGRITAAEATAEREGLLAAHHARVAEIRARHLGEEPG